MTTPKLPLIYTISINKAQTIRLAAYSTLLVFLSAALFSYLVGDGSNTPINPVMALIVYFLTLVVHEFIHGLFFWLFGGKPKYGVGVMYRILPYAYATADGQPYNLRQMLIVGMAPFVLLCTAAVAVGVLVPELSAYAAIVFIGNFAGAIGDMWLMRQLLRFRKLTQATFVDLKSGVAIHGPADEAQPIIEKLHKINDPNTKSARFSLAWITSFFSLLMTSIMTMIILSLAGFKGHLLIGPTEFPLFEMNTLGDGFFISIGILPIIAASTLFALIYAALLKKQDN